MSSVKQSQMLSQRIEKLERRVAKYEILEDKVNDLLRTLVVRLGDVARLEIGDSAVIVDSNGVTIKGAAIKIDGSNEVDITTGVGRVTIRKDGTVVIKARSFDIDASGQATVKAGGNLTLKGSKIMEN